MAYLYTHSWLTTINRSEVSGVIFLDLRKALASLIRTLWYTSVIAHSHKRFKHVPAVSACGIQMGIKEQNGNWFRRTKTCVMVY